ncbi:hypothetical protein J1614_001612 [Plenodomus biglobosus]|nr:hypothetical protein J1614_001612 [Plenodomus biglobosus]
MAKTNSRARLLFLSLLAHVATSSAASTPRPTINTTNGTVVGVHNTQFDQDFFLGIPYAQPPIGPLRYNRPEPVAESWEQRDATETGAWCHSAPVALPVFMQNGFSHEENEDCLTVNVVRPTRASNDSKLPVLVWIHGGGFSEGSSGDQRYNMSFLVQESVNIGAPIIGVSLNYRVSGFGFLPGSLLNESQVANLGLYDQRLALNWIHDNIAAFGGDSSLITIQGESAGAISVGHHFLAYGGRDDGLFRAGIMQSGGVGLGPSFLSYPEQDILYNNILNQTGCTGSNDTLNCLRDVPAETLKRVFQGQQFFPVVDGDMIAEHPVNALKKGKFVKRPILAGTNTNEGTSFAINEGVFANTTTQFRSIIARYFSPNTANTTIDAIAAEYLENMSPQAAQKSLGTVLPYSRPEYGALYGRATLFRGDQVFVAPRRFSLQVWAQNRIPAYSYHFDTLPGGVDPITLGVTHFAEIPFVFGNVNGVGHEINLLGSNSTEEREQYLRLSRRMTRMWLSFVNEMTPNARYAREPRVKWPRYTNRNAVNMVFRATGLSLEPDTMRKRAIGRLNSLEFS